MRFLLAALAIARVVTVIGALQRGRPTADRAYGGMLVTLFVMVVATAVALVWLLVASSAT